MCATESYECAKLTSASAFFFMNVPQFLVICHFPFCHTHFDYVIITFFSSLFATFKMCLP
jgi:hypothetical protein